MDSMFESLIWTRGLVGLACQARRREQDRQLSCLTLNLTPALYPIPGASQVRGRPTCRPQRTASIIPMARPWLGPRPHANADLRHRNLIC